MRLSSLLLEVVLIVLAMWSCIFGYACYRYSVALFASDQILLSFALVAPAMGYLFLTSVTVYMAVHLAGKLADDPRLR